MDISTLIFALMSLFASVFSLSIGVYISVKYPKITLTSVFYTICIVLASVNFIEFQMRIANTHADAFIWGKLFGIWPLVLTTSLHFVLVFREEIKKTVSTYMLLYVPAIIIIYLELTTNLISIKPTKTDWGYGVTTASTPYFIASTLWTLSILGIILYHAYKNYVDSFGLKKKQARLILIGLLLNFLIGITTDLIFKLINIQVPSLGYSLSIISFGLIAYSIKRYHFFEITPESIAGKIIATINDSVILVNSTKHIVEINPSTCKTLGYEKNELIGQPIQSIVHNFNDLCTKCCDLVKTKKAADFEAVLISRENSKFTILLSCNPIYLDNNKDSGIVFIGRDISERKKAETLLKLENSKLEDLVSKRTENLSRINNQLIHEVSKHENSVKKLLQTIQKMEESERAKIAFFDNLAHEISTPINSIIGFSDLLNDDDITREDINNYTRIIQNSCNQLQLIVRDTVNLARIEKNKEQINIEEINCNELLQSLYNQFKPLAEKNKIEFACFKKLRDNEACIETDQIKLTQIITNLLTNAFKFTNEGFIHFGYTVSSDKITFFVRDTGIGIPDVSKDIIFERFVQANSDISHKYGGSGLGLSIAKIYVTFLGGEIWVDSNENKGSNFYFWLPYTYKTEHFHEI